MIETDDEDGQLENGSVQAGSVAKKNGAVAVANPGSAMRVEKCKIGKEWQEHNGENWEWNKKTNILNPLIRSNQQAQVTADVRTARW